MPVRQQLAERGLEIPPAQVIPPGVRLTYRRLVRHGNVAYIAGHGPTHGDGWGRKLGTVGRDVTVEEAVAAAQLTALNVLGTIERELGGPTDRVLAEDQRLRPRVDGFTEHATVINGSAVLDPTARIARGADVGRRSAPAVRHAGRGRRCHRSRDRSRAWRLDGQVALVTESARSSVRRGVRRSRCASPASICRGALEAAVEGSGCRVGASAIAEVERRPSSPRS
jgi:hypothetical protein